MTHLSNIKIKNYQNTYINYNGIWMAEIREADVKPRCKASMSVLYQIQQRSESRQNQPTGVRSSHSHYVLPHTVC